MDERRKTYLVSDVLKNFLQRSSGSEGRKRPFLEKNLNTWCVKCTVMTYPIRKKKTHRYQDWPIFDHVQGIQSFVDSMCERYNIPAIHVRVVPKWYMEKYSKRAIAVAHWGGAQNGTDEGKEVWFCTEHFGFPTATYQPKKKVSTGSPIDIMRVVIHEFSHHVVFHNYGIHERPHGFRFWSVCRAIEADFGIFTVPFTNIAWKWPMKRSWWFSSSQKEVRINE